MDVIYVPLKELKPAEYNPRKMSKKQAKDLRESIKRFGLVDPLIVNKYPGRENIIIGGHQRLNIALELGYKEVPVIYVDLPEDKERELNLRLNKNLGDWDWQKLADFDIDLLVDVGFDANELAKRFDIGELNDVEYKDTLKMTITLTYPQDKHNEVIAEIREMCKRYEGMTYYV